MLWVKGSATVRELHEAVSQERALGYTTVLKLLQIMTEKGLVQRAEVGRAHVYRATASQEETQSQLLRDLSRAVVFRLRHSACHARIDDGAGNQR